MFTHRKVRPTLFVTCLIAFAGTGWTQQNSGATGAQPPLTPREQQMLDRIEKLEQRLAVLEAREKAAPGSPAVEAKATAASTQTSTQSGPASSTSAPPQSAIASVAPGGQPPPNSPALPDILQGTTINGYLDTYYEYNFNDPIGRVNLLRSFDVSSNAFSLNQADIVVENAPDVAKGKRWGARIDLQFGQATQTLQGNGVNEPRPDIYRSIFQAYGTYVVPVGSGLTVDFGKWASSLGIEGNYTKDDINYSRSFWFDFLPFYHMGLRANYKVNNVLGLNYWIVNGTQQTEPFNGYKDEMFGFTLQPHKTLNWTVNYYLGQEHPDVVFNPVNAPPGLPNEQGIPFEPIPNPPNGKLHIFDSYATWQPNAKWTFAGEGDYVLERLHTYSAPERASGGAAYARYQLTPKFAIGARAEYLSDRGGLFSGVIQALKEMTFTTEYKLGDGLLMRGEWRRDFSNMPYFYTSTLGILKREQNTSTLGLVWWFGQKQGAW